MSEDDPSLGRYRIDPAELFDQVCVRKPVESIPFDPLLRVAPGGDAG
jgi:hypothetical protein